MKFDPYPEFAERLEQFLQDQDRSPSWLAKQLHIQPSTVTRWLNEKTRPKERKTVEAIAQILQLTSSQLPALLTAAGYGTAQTNKTSLVVRSSTGDNSTLGLMSHDFSAYNEGRARSAGA